MFFFPFLVNPPKIVQHPSCQAAPTGAQTSFTVGATGDDLTFQWQKNARDVHNDSNFNGTDTNTLTIRQVKKSHAGCYRCLVMNEVKKDGILSGEAELSVCKFNFIYCFTVVVVKSIMKISVYCLFLVDPPKVTWHPYSQSAPTGAQTTFTVEATGDDLIFQWQKDGGDVHNDSNYSGTDTNTLSIRHVKKSEEGRYRCLVKNELKRDGEVSEEAELTVCECPSDIVAVVVYYCNLCL